MSLLQRIFGSADRRQALNPLYRAIVALARDSGWYRDGGVPDTIDGRFDMVAAATALVLQRLEAEGKAAREDSVLLSELFVADMDSSLREIGIGDHVVGKHVSRMMGALGGRLRALRAAREQGDFRPFVDRNVFHDAPLSDESSAYVASRLQRIDQALATQPLAELMAGRIAAG